MHKKTKIMYICKYIYNLCSLFLLNCELQNMTSGCHWEEVVWVFPLVPCQLYHSVHFPSRICLAVANSIGAAHSQTAALCYLLLLDEAGKPCLSVLFRERDYLWQQLAW
jgi:hypothetical protein